MRHGAHRWLELGKQGAAAGDEFQQVVRCDVLCLSREEMTSQQGEVLRIIRELEFDHHSNLVFVIYNGLCRLGQDDAGA